MTTIAAVCSQQNARDVNPLLYPPEARRAARNIFEQWANSRAIGGPCNSRREFSFGVEARSVEKSVAVCERATKTFELFAKVLAQFNPGKRSLFNQVHDIGTDGVCLSMDQKVVSEFNKLDFRGPCQFLAGF